MLARSLKMTFWVAYDHIGKLLIANLIWAIGITLPGVFALSAFNTGDPAIALFAGLPFLYIALGAVGPILTAALAHMAKVLIETGDGSLGDLLDGVKQHWRRAWAVGTILFCITGALALSAWFYATQLSNTLPWLGFAIAAISLWMLAFVLVCIPFAMPTLVQKRDTVPATLKLTAIIVIDNPLLAIGVAIQWAALLALAVIMLPIFFGLYGALCVLLASSAYEILARKYAAQRQPEGATTQNHPYDDYLNRGFRDFLFPWKG